MRINRLIQLVTLLPCTAWALSRSEAGVVDWQKTLVGVPKVQSPATRPTFYRLPLRDGTTLAFLLTMTNSNIFAAMDPVKGSVAWRHVFGDDDPVLAFKANQDGVATLSGLGGANVKIFEVYSGALVWERKLHNSLQGRLLEPENLGGDLAFAVDQSPDLFVLANADSVYRLGGLIGELIWKWDAPDAGSMTLHSKIVVTEKTVHVIGLVKSFASYTLSVTALDAITGKEISTTLIPSSIEDITRDILTLVRRTHPNPQLVWREGTSLKSVALSASNRQSQTPLVIPGFTKIFDVSLDTSGYFVALRTNGSTAVFSQVEDSRVGIEKTWDFMDITKAQSNSEPVFGGGIGRDGQPYISKMQWSHTFGACTMHLHAPHASQGRGAVTGFTYQFDTLQHGVLLYAALDVANPGPMQFVSRFALTTSTGSFQMWQQEKLLWVREESLAGIQAATFADFPLGFVEAEAVVPVMTKEPKSMLNTIVDLVKLPYQSIVRTGVANTAWRNKLGFRKMIIVGTSYGKVMALDSTSGEVIWGQLLSLNDISGMPLDAKMKIFLLKSADKEGVEAKLRVGVVVSAASATGVTKTAIYHLDALTGMPVGDKAKLGFAVPAYEFDGVFTEAFAVEGTETALVVVDASQKVHIYPSTARSSFQASAPKINFHSTIGGRRLTGYKVTSQPKIVANGKTIFGSYPTWSTALGHQDINSIVKNAENPLASYGKVLGDRSTLYKYINQHLMAVTTFASPEGTCGVYLVDAVKGAVIYSAQVTGATRDCGLRATLVDNWLVYYHHEDVVKGAEGAKGHRLVTVELYEGDGPDQDLGSFDLSSLSNETTRASAIQRSFVIPYGIKALAPTQTKYGISMKDIIVNTDSNQVLSIPRRLLDPRRPNGAATPAEQEEGLIPFNVVLHDDARRILSHTKEVFNTKQILAAPVQLESTSLIFAYGLDLFQTRVSPSNTFDELHEDFNRIQLVLTILGLAAGIVVTKPIVRSKALSTAWC